MQQPTSVLQMTTRGSLMEHQRRPVRGEKSREPMTGTTEGGNGPEDRPAEVPEAGGTRTDPHGEEAARMGRLDFVERQLACGTGQQSNKAPPRVRRG